MIDSIKARDALMQSIRAFFHAKGFVEVETPIRLRTPCMELHIDAEPSGDHFLRTSPELSHKKLLARGAEKIFEVAKCFRQGEKGNLHNPEYTMLEWYRTGGDYMTALTDTQALLERVFRDFPRSRTSATDCRAGVETPPFPSTGGAPKGRGGFSCDWKTFTVEEVFEKFAGWNPVDDFDADRFDFDLVEKVEPNLPKDCPVVLKDYPAELCALARMKPGNTKVAERWELYLNGIEIANAYSELTDPVEQRARFEKWGAQRKVLGKPVYELDEEFLQCLDPSVAREAPLLRGNDRRERQKMPEACGVALGLDRLLMILSGETSLDAVLPFR